MKYTILSQTEYTALDMCGPALSKLGGCGDTFDEKGLASYQYSFEVEVTNIDNETQKFNIDFQPTERNEGLKNYNGHGLSTAGQYGCDSDESEELLIFCDYDATVLFELEEIATKAAKIELERLLAK